MNIVLLDQYQLKTDVWKITAQRQLIHLRTHIDIQVGDTLKVGFIAGERYLTEIIEIQENYVTVKPLHKECCPDKLPVNLIVSLPRPKVLRRLIMDSVTLGVEKITLLHSYRVDKSYWQSPLLQQLDQYVTLGLEQAGDTRPPQIEIYKRFKPFVEDILPDRITADRPAFVAHPYARDTVPNAFNQACSIIVGPEGGFIPYEIDLLTQNGCQAMQLGQRILRTETVIPYLLGRLFTI
ncbi:MULTISPECIES: 16S rRNA (uracil(1498)-N(3))-methyltransferase [unclassified Acinetobacter]|uniref:16S rRNA (uracil(1498)-N(3))-methyltransferase n=1 Tax=unclassified Acinetobacter TaxID=196816 RepID=UPI0029344AC7|nr:MULTISPECIES: 16S rRNA (uracil(1498)-N(3))-methyltransferase [unclassified Acinetobacter]WOE30978.1 16S rRNA (uracil(1498)-N(3))-methyltransferase [Acinetobacter sp. SAAs470]WOE39174.1 16S rRNA (uracil(1498)-N(3))-methyltransferase [Acinetobacter sp. SAAs474]